MMSLLSAEGSFIPCFLEGGCWTLGMGQLWQLKHEVCNLVWLLHARQRCAWCALKRLFAVVSFRLPWEAWASTPTPPSPPKSSQPLPTPARLARPPPPPPARLLDHLSNLRRNLAAAFLPGSGDVTDDYWPWLKWRLAQVGRPAKRPARRPGGGGRGARIRTPQQDGVAAAEPGSGEGRRAGAAGRVCRRHGAGRHSWMTTWKCKWAGSKRACSGMQECSKPANSPRVVGPGDDATGLAWPWRHAMRGPWQGQRDCEAT